MKILEHPVAADRGLRRLRAARSASAKTDAVSGVGKNPGASALQQMPRADQVSAIARVS